MKLESLGWKQHTGVALREQKIVEPIVLEKRHET